MFEAYRLDADSDEDRTGNHLSRLVAQCHEANWKRFSVCETRHYETVYHGEYGYGLLLPGDDLPDALHGRYINGGWFIDWYYFPPSEETKDFCEAASAKPLTIADHPDALSS
jgi:hypothetical protein